MTSSNNRDYFDLYTTLQHSCIRHPGKPRVGEAMIFVCSCMYNKYRLASLDILQNLYRQQKRIFQYFIHTYLFTKNKEK